MVLKNRDLVLPEDARVSLDDVDVAYGYGVYETLKVRNGILYYPQFHEERLFQSAAIIGIVHDFQPGEVVELWKKLIRSAGDPGKNCNIKILFIGHSEKPADLYGYVLNPLYPKRKELKNGATCILYTGERHFPQAKSLSMLLSTLAYRQARSFDAYDAILVNKSGHITEGTRTNVFYYYSDSGVLPPLVYTPPLSYVLNGITRRTIIDCFTGTGILVEERALHLSELLNPESKIVLFVCSTSTKILPIRTLIVDANQHAGETNANFIAGREIPMGVPDSIKELQGLYNHYLDEWSDDQEPVFNES